MQKAQPARVVPFTMYAHFELFMNYYFFFLCSIKN